MKKFEIILEPNIHHNFLPIPDLPGNVSVNNLNCMVSPSFLTLPENVEFDMNIRVSILLPQEHFLALSYFAVYFLKDNGMILDRLPIELIKQVEHVPDSTKTINPPNYLIAPITDTVVISNPEAFHFRTLPLPDGVDNIEFLFPISGVLTLFWDESSTQTGFSIPFAFYPKLKITTGGSDSEGIDG